MKLATLNYGDITTKGIKRNLYYKKNYTREMKYWSTVLNKFPYLKDIPFCSCGRLSGNRIREITSDMFFSDSKKTGYLIEIDQSVIAVLEKGATLIKDTSNLICHFDFETSFTTMSWLPENSLFS